MYKYILKPFLFLFYPEISHNLALRFFKIGLSIPVLKQVLLNAYDTAPFDKPQQLFGLQFKNPIGLAAGFDKDGKYIDLVSKLGFGFIEIGTVTPKPQAGNPKPRLFRLKKDKALINRMGFNNDGVDAMVERLKNHKKKGIIIGGNIGKNKTTPNEDAYLDYLICFEKLHSLVDYFVVNVSSPNTPGLRDLQQVDSLKKILEPLVSHKLQKERTKPILLKIAPDMALEDLTDILNLLQTLKIDGIIATNTTIDRSNLSTSALQIKNIGNGGLSGQPLYKKSDAIIQHIKKQTNGKLPIIGVGGIHDELTAQSKFENGASLIQLYTGFIYEGPKVIKNILKSLA